MLTIEEQERQAYQQGNITLAAALGHIMALENSLREAHALLNEARLDGHVTDTDWCDRAAAAVSP